MESSKNIKYKIKNKLLVILGPTASGKSDLAIYLARLFNGEIVSADSRQIYQEMNIGTGKVKIEKRNNKIYSQNIRHHLIDILNPQESFSASQYQKLAIKTIKDIQKRDKLPILCGGTGLYISAVTENWQFPTIPPQNEFRKQLEEKTTTNLYQMYKKLDPQGAKVIDLHNRRRLIRAIEVCHFTQKPFWQQRQQNKPLFQTLFIEIKLSKEKLHQNIVRRIKKMIDNNLEKETKSLVEKYGWISSLQSIGYQEWKEYFEKKINKKEVQKLIELHTLNYAKRQNTWFKKYFKTHQITNKEESQELVHQFLLE